jgi:type II secretory pathway pseudopilin PulG
MFRYILSIFIALMGFVYLADSLFGSFLILISAVLFFQNFQSVIRLKLNKFKSVFCYLIGFVLLVVGISIYASSPSYIARMDKIREEEKEAQAKKDEETLAENIQKQKEQELASSVQKSKDDETKAKEEARNNAKKRADEYAKNVSMFSGQNGFWLINKNEKPLKIQNLSLNYNMANPSKYYDFTYPQGSELNNIRKQEVKNGQESKVFSYTEFADFPNESVFFVKGYNKVNNIQVQASFEDDLSSYGINEFTTTWNTN